MRFLKWISVLTILALLCAMLPATVAEDEIVIDAEESVEGELEIEIDDLEGLDDFVDPTLSLDDAGLELDGLEDNLLTADVEEQTEAPTAAVANASSDFVIDEDGVLTKYNGFDKNVVIPDGVTGISGSVFSGYDVETVVIPNGVTWIGGGAFSGCKFLKSITLPDSLESLSSWAFYGCESLTSISIPKNVNDLGRSVFQGCFNLSQVEILGKVEIINDNVFLATALKNLDFLKKPGVTTILDSAFAGCDGFENLTIPDCVTKIGVWTFNGCPNLKTVTIPDTVETIEDGAFGNCPNLESITIPASVTSIDRGAFDNSNNVVIRGTAGTYAERYANGMGIPFNAPVIILDEETIRDWDNDSYYSILYINQSRTLNAVQKPTGLARKLTWSSSDTKVVTVDQTGKITGVSQGEATITAATADGKGKAGQLMVVVPEPTDMKLNLDSWDTITLNQTETIRAYKSIPYQYETRVEMPITWSTSNSSIISIEATDGDKATLKGKKLGKTTITATTPDGGKSSMEIEVIRPEIDDINIDQSGPITLHPGDQYTLTATVSPDGADPTVEWSSDNTSVVRVSSNGVVTAVGEGDAYVKAKSASYYSDSIEIYVEPLHPHPVSISINQPGPLELYVGQKFALSVTMKPSDAAAVLSWSPDNRRIATVSQDGVITAVSEGFTCINVKTDNGESDYIEVYVLAAPKKVTLNKTKATLGVGDTLTLKATLSPSAAKTGFTWSSSKPSVAKVSKNGKVTALKVGTAKITVTTTNGKTAKATITVKAAPKKVKLSKTKAALGVKEKLTLKATFSPSSAYSTLTWKSSKPAVASVSSKGVVTPKRTGTAVISVKTKNGKTAKATITVKAAPKTVTLNKSGEVTLAKGKKLKLKATLPADTASALTWKSSNPKVAAVDKNGMVTAKKAGTAVITVTTFNGKTAKVTVRVK